jgi:hypothetical protein
MKYHLLVVLALLPVLAGCGKNRERIPSADGPPAQDRSLGLIAADTIIYDVVIRNPNPDDTWKALCLSRVNYAVLIDSIFNMVYSGRISAFNHETREKLTNRQVQEIEKADGFSRDKIGMIQFTEVWYLNPAEKSMHKKVISMVLGYDYYTPEGELFGHKPVFRVDLN